MAIKQYILTIDDTALTDELRQLLSSKGAELHEAPIEELDIPEAEARKIALVMDEAAKGKRYKSWQQVKAESRAYRAQRRKDA